jgi:hypothetical protein
MAQIQCPNCGGRGQTPTPSGQLYQICPRCGGSGRIEPPYKPMPYSYIINPATTGQVYVAASTKVSGQLQIDAKADFLVRKILSTQTGAFSVTFKDGSSGRNWQNLPINNLNFSGTAQLPFWMTAKIVIKARATLDWEVTDLSGQNNTIQISLSGEDLYPLGPTTQSQQAQIVGQQ